MTNPNTCATGLYLEGFLDHRNVIYQHNNYVYCIYTFILYTNYTKRPLTLF